MLAIYTRLSRESEESNSIENQIREGKEFAKNKGFEYKIYNEGEGISGGAEIKYRPQLEMMLADMTSGKITAVYTRKGERIARNVHTWYTFADLVKEKNIDVYYQGVLQHISTPDGTLFSRLLSDFNAYTIEKQSYLTKRSLLDNVLEGKAHGKSTPLGYKADAKGYIVIDEAEKPIVETIYRMCLEGKGSTTIKHYLNDNNIPTRYNKGKGTFKIKNKYTGKVSEKNKSDVKWSDRQVQSILKNPMYKGKRKWGDKLIDCPAIFDEAYWDKIQTQYKLNAHSKNTGKKVDHKYLLKGLLECSKCNRNYYGRTRVNKRDNYYMCSSKRYKDLNCSNRAINIDVLDDFVWGLMYEDSLYDNMVAMVEKGDNSKRLQKLKESIEAYTDKVESLQKQIKKSLGYLTNDTITESEYLTIKKQKETKIKTLNELKARDEEELFLLENQKTSIQEFTKEREKYVKLRVSSEVLKSHNLKLVNSKDNIIAPYNDKKRVLNNYVKRIFIEYSKEHKVYVIRTSFKLPIDDTLHFIDDNYLYSYDANNSVIMELASGQNTRFTEATYDRTLKKLLSKELIENLV